MIPFITTYNPDFTSHKKIVEEDWELLPRSSTTKDLSEHGILFGYRRPKNLRDILVRAKVRPATGIADQKTKPKMKDIRKCNNIKCRYCPIINKSGTITSTYTGTTYYTMKNVTCRSPNLIYCITCKTCKMQYVGQTKNTLMKRFQGHFQVIKAKNQLIDTGRHFNLPDHRGTRDLEIHILDYIRAPPDSATAAVLRDKKEYTWIQRLRSQIPMGINTMDRMPRVPRDYRLRFQPVGFKNPATAPRARP